MGPQYEKRLELDIGTIEDGLSVIIHRVENALSDAVQALLTGDRKLSYETILNDKGINRLDRELHQLCYKFIIKHLPAARHLRFVSSVMEMVSELERIGDYAVTICRESVQLSSPPRGQVLEHLQIVWEEVKVAFKQAVAALDTKNEKAAKKAFKLTKLAPKSFDRVYDYLVGNKELPQNDLFAYLVIFNMFLRVADRTENICEEVIFEVTGRQKATKRFPILFLDKENTCLSQIAQAIAQKLFSHRSTFESVGLTPKDCVDPDVVEFLKSKGCDMDGVETTAIDSIDLNKYYVIVGLEGPLKKSIQDIPFHSVALDWSVGSSLKKISAEGEEKTEYLENLYRDISSRIHDLMEKLYGKEGINCES